MSDLDKLERIKSKLLYAVTVGHEFIPVSRLMVVVNRITTILGHVRPLEYKPTNPEDSPQHKVYDALDDAYRELHNVLSGRDQLEGKWEDLYNLLSEIKNARDRAYDAEHGPQSSLLKRGRKFSQF